MGHLRSIGLRRPSRTELRSARHCQATRSRQAARASAGYDNATARSTSPASSPCRVPDVSDTPASCRASPAWVTPDPASAWPRTQGLGGSPVPHLRLDGLRRPPSLLRGRRHDGCRPLRDVADVGGVRLMQRTGVLPAIEARAPANVTYRLDDQGSLAGDPVDRGTLSLDARGTLALSATTPCRRMQRPAGSRHPVQRRRHDRARLPDEAVSGVRLHRREPHDVVDRSRRAVIWLAVHPPRRRVMAISRLTG